MLLLRLFEVAELDRAKDQNRAAHGHESRHLVLSNNIGGE